MTEEQRTDPSLSNRLEDRVDLAGTEDGRLVVGMRGDESYWSQDAGARGLRMTGVGLRKWIVRGGKGVVEVLRRREVVVVAARDLLPRNSE